METKMQTKPQPELDGFKLVVRSNVKRQRSGDKTSRPNISSHADAMRLSDRPRPNRGKKLPFGSRSPQHSKGWNREWEKEQKALNFAAEDDVEVPLPTTAAPRDLQQFWDDEAVYQQCDSLYFETRKAKKYYEVVPITFWQATQNAKLSIVDRRFRVLVTKERRPRAVYELKRREWVMYDRRKFHDLLHPAWPNSDITSVQWKNMADDYLSPTCFLPDFYTQDDCLPMDDLIVKGKMEAKRKEYLKVDKPLHDVWKKEKIAKNKVKRSKKKEKQQQAALPSPAELPDVSFGTTAYVPIVEGKLGDVTQEIAPLHESVVVDTTQWEQADFFETAWQEDQKEKVASQDVFDTWSTDGNSSQCWDSDIASTSPPPLEQRPRNVRRVLQAVEKRCVSPQVSKTVEIPHEVEEVLDELWERQHQSCCVLPSLVEHSKDENDGPDFSCIGVTLASVPVIIKCVKDIDRARRTRHRMPTDDKLTCALIHAHNALAFAFKYDSEYKKIYYSRAYKNTCAQICKAIRDETLTRNAIVWKNWLKYCIKKCGKVVYCEKLLDVGELDIIAILNQERHPAFYYCVSVITHTAIANCSNMGSVHNDWFCRNYDKFFRLDKLAFDPKENITVPEDDEAPFVAEMSKEGNVTFDDKLSTTVATGMIRDQKKAPVKAAISSTPWSVQQTLGKPLQRYSFEWGVKHAKYTTLVRFALDKDMFSCYHKEFVKRFVFFRGHPKIRLQVNGTKFHSGRLIAYLVPAEFKGEYDDELFVRDNISTLPHVYVDASSSNSGVLDIPFSALDSYFNFDYDHLWNTLGTVNIKVFNVLGASDTTSQSIGCSLWFSYTQCELHVPRGVTKKQEEECELINLKSEMGLLDDAIGLGIGAVSDIALEALSRTFPLSGSCDKPTTTKEIKRFVPNAVTGLATGEGVDRATRLALSMDGFTQSNANVISQTPNDMDLKLLLHQVPARVTTIKWSADYTSGKHLLSWLLMPGCCTEYRKSAYTDTHEITMSLVDYVAGAFEFWNGGLDFQVSVVASQMHTGRLVFIFVPSIVEPVSLQADSAYNTFVMDLQESHDTAFTVPYVAERSWKRTAPLGYDIQNHDTRPRDLDACALGYLHIYVQNRLVAPTGCSKDVEINLFMSGAKNFQVAVPREMISISNSGPSDKDEMIAQMSDKMEEPKLVTDTRLAATAAKPVLGKDDGTKMVDPKSTIGESHMDVLAVCKRYQHVATIRTPMDYKKEAAFSFVNSPTLGSYTEVSKQLRRERTLTAHFSELYTFWRGSMRYKIVFSSTSFQNSRAILRVVHLPMTSLPKHNFVWGEVTDEMRSYLHSATNYGTIVLESGVQSSLEFEIPFYTVFNQLKCHAYKKSHMHCTGTIVVFLEIISGYHNYHDSIIEIYQSIGDDFRFNYFRGVPLLCSFDNAVAITKRRYPSFWGTPFGRPISDPKVGLPVPEPYEEKTVTYDPLEENVIEVTYRFAESEWKSSGKGSEQDYIDWYGPLRTGIQKLHLRKAHVADDTELPPEIDTVTPVWRAKDFDLEQEDQHKVWDMDEDDLAERKKQKFAFIPHANGKVYLYTFGAPLARVPYEGQRPFLAQMGLLTTLGLRSEPAPAGGPETVRGEIPNNPQPLDQIQEEDVAIDGVVPAVEEPAPKCTINEDFLEQPTPQQSRFKALLDLPSKLGGACESVSEIRADAVGWSEQILEVLKSFFTLSTDMVGEVKSQLGALTGQICTMFKSATSAFDIVQFVINMGVLIKCESIVLKVAACFFCLKYMLNLIGAPIDSLTEFVKSYLLEIFPKKSEEGMSAEFSGIIPSIFSLLLNGLFVYLATFAFKSASLLQRNEFLTKIRTILAVVQLSNSLPKLMENVQSIFEQAQVLIARHLCPTLLFSSDLGNPTKIFEWACEIDKLEATNYVDRCNINPEVRFQIYELKDFADNLLERILENKITAASSMIREYSRKIGVMANTVRNASTELPSRINPCSIFFVGETGVGKSSLIPALAHELCDEMKYPRYNRWCAVNPQEQFFTENYNGQTCIYIDDFSTFIDQKQYENFHCLKSNSSFPLNMAFKKGLHFTSHFIYATTNTPYPHPNCMNNIPALWARRNLLIEMKLKPEAAELRSLRKQCVKTDNSHALFRLLNPEKENEPISTWVEWSIMKEHIFEYAKTYLQGQRQKVASDLKIAGYNHAANAILNGLDPDAVTELPPPPEVPVALLPPAETDEGEEYDPGEAASSNMTAEAVDGCSFVVNMDKWDKDLTLRMFDEDWIKTLKISQETVIFDMKQEQTKTYLDFCRATKTDPVKLIHDACDLKLPPTKIQYLKDCAATVAKAIQGLWAKVPAWIKNLSSLAGLFSMAYWLHKMFSKDKIDAVAQIGYSVREQAAVMPKMVAQDAEYPNLFLERCVPYLYVATVPLATGVRKVLGMAVGGKWLLLPRHMFDMAKESVGFFNLAYASNWKKCWIQEGRYHYLKDKDAVLYRCPPFFHDHRSACHLFVSESELHRIGTGPALLATRDETGVAKAISFDDIKYVNNVKYACGEASLKVNGFRYTHSQDGDCGAILYTKSNHVAGKMLGMHICGNGSYGVAQLITKEMLQEIVEENNSGLPLPAVRDKPATLVPPNIDYVGVVDKGSALPTKTKIKASILLDEFGPHQKEPAVLTPNDPRLKEKVSPITKAIAKYAELPVEPFNPQLLANTRQFLVSMLYNACVDVKPLSLDEAINGTGRGDALNMTTSPGYPYTLTRPANVVGKGYLFENGKIKDKQLALLYDIRLQKAKNGERTESIVVDCLKDEKRPLSKIYTGSTRLFSLFPVDYTLLCRRYTLDFCNQVMSPYARQLTFCKVGINPYSTEWDELANRLLENSPHCVDLDFSNFDGSIPAECIAEFCSVIQTLGTGSFTPTDNFILRTLFEEVIHTVHLAKNEVYVTHHGNPSGNPTTAIMNSCINYMFLGYAWLIAFKDTGMDTMRDFFSNVALAIYGDDVIMSVKPHVMDVYNPANIADILARHGIKVQSATKQTGPIKFKELKDCIFLKNKFVYGSVQQGVWSACLDFGTIVEMLNWIKSSPDDMAMLRTNIDTAQRFMFFYGREQFDAFTKKVAQLVVKFKITEITLWTWDDLLVKYMHSKVIDLNEFMW